MSERPTLDSTVHLDSRVLFLSQDLQLVRRQLAGEALALEQLRPLGDNISTDGITPAWICYHVDEKLGAYPT